MKENSSRKRMSSNLCFLRFFVKFLEDTGTKNVSSTVSKLLQVAGAFEQNLPSVEEIGSDKFVQETKEILASLTKSVAELFAFAVAIVAILSIVCCYFFLFYTFLSPDPEKAIGIAILYVVFLVLLYWTFRYFLRKIFIGALKKENETLIRFSTSINSYEEKLENSIFTSLCQF